MRQRIFVSHVEYSDGTRYGVVQRAEGMETLFRDPPKVSGRDRKRNRKNARRRLGSGRPVMRRNGVTTPGRR